MVVYDYIAGEPYTPIKVKLHDPAGENAKSLYPVTVLGAIVESLDTEDALATTITNTSNQIKYKYLEPFYADGNQGKIYNTYLNIDFATNGKISSDSLNIFNNDGKIMSDLLPSFVDDVVEIPVLGGTDYPAGDLMIRVGENDEGVTTYTFYHKTDDDNWVIGGGETGKIYIAAASGGVGDGSIYRCVSGSTSTAIKISENPYAIDTTATNGVSLVIDGGDLRAEAVSATYGRFGTVQISNAATNNVALTCVDGVVAVSAGVAAPTLTGVVYAVANQTAIDFISENVGSGALAYTVPTAEYMQEYVGSQITGINFATKNAPGIVQIGSNIDVGDSGLISVNSAADERWGVVQIVDTIATTAAGNAGNTAKAVTLGGIVTYVDAKMSYYQKVLLEGPGIDITTTENGDVISIAAESPLAFTNELLAGNQKLTINDATTGARGVVIYTGDSGHIEECIVKDDDGHPIVVNAKAVHDYVEAKLTGCPIPTEDSRGGIRVSSANTGLELAGTPADILKINRTAPLYVNDNNTLAVYSATLAASGVVNVVSTGAQMAVEDYAEYVPQNQAIIDYLSSQSFGSTYVFSSGTVENGGTVTADVNTTTYPWMALDANGIGVVAATSGSSGVVALETSVDGLSTVTATNSTYVPTVKVISSYLVSNYQSSGSYQAPLDFSSGVSKTTVANGNDVVKAVVVGAPMYVGETGIGVSAAGEGTTGVVALTSESSNIATVTTTNSKYVPTVKAVSAYVLDKTPSYTSGVSCTVNADTNASSVTAVVNTTTYPWMVLDANGIGVSTATAAQAGVVTLVETSATVVVGENSQCVPTASALIDYVTGQMSTLPIAGTNPIYVDDGTIGLYYEAPLKLNGSSLTVSKATTAASGVVTYLTSNVWDVPTPADSALVTHPLAVASAMIEITDWVSGLTGINLTSGSVTVTQVEGTSDYQYTKTKASIGLATATSGAIGGVKIVSKGTEVSATSNSAHVPTNSALKEYVSTYVDGKGYQAALTQGPGIWIGNVTNDDETVTSNVISAKVNAGSGGVTFDTASNLALKSAAFVDTSNGSTFNDVFVPLGGVRVHSGGGIRVNNGVISLVPAAGVIGGVIVPTSATSSGVQVDAAGNLKLNAATANYLGGIKLAATSTGLTTLTGGETLRINTLAPLYIDDDNYLAVATANGPTSSGVVTTLSNTAQISAGIGSAAAVPTADGLIAYVSTALTGTDVAKLDGNGLSWADATTTTPKTLNVGATFPLAAGADAITINTASASDLATLPNTALGVVYVRSEIRDSATIKNDTLKTNTVPNESAVRDLVDTTSTSIIQAIDARLYITYTAV